MTSFESSIALLQSYGFKVEGTGDESDPNVYKVVGFGIYGHIGDATGTQQHAQLEGALAVDNIACYRKVEKCPLVIRLPLEESQLKILKWLGTQKGHEYSSTYAYLTGDKLPLDIESEEQKLLRKLHANT